MCPLRSSYFYYFFENAQVRYYDILGIIIITSYKFLYDVYTNKYKDLNEITVTLIQMNEQVQCDNDML